MKKEVEQEKEESNQVPYKEHPNIKNDTSLAKINSTLYNEVVEIVEANPIDYPSIKHFIEVAVRNHINSIVYDIENKEALIGKDGKLKLNKKEFTTCLACNNLFLNEKEKNKQGRKVCPKCTSLINKLYKFIDYE